MPIGKGMENPNAITISLEIARDLVSPYSLNEALETLKQEGLISEYWMGETIVKIIPHPTKRFDIAIMALDSAFEWQVAKKKRVP